jgi:hypothetical protein
MKTIIYTILHHNGLGDSIRGLISIKQIQKKVPFAFELHVSMSDYAPGVFFKKKNKIHYNTNNVAIISKVYDNETNHHQELIDCIQTNFKEEDVIYFYTNAYPIVNEIDDEIKNFMKQQLTLTKEAEQYVNECQKLLPNEYNLFHYRLGDPYLIKNSTENINKFVEHFDKNKKEDSVLISDCLEFKKKIAEKETGNDVFVFLNNPVHSGLRHYSKDEYKETIRDFNLIKNAKKIYSFSVYHLISNFVFWTSLIYDVPLEKI